MTSPSLRTIDVVATPTLAVCGATGLPTSAPTEFSDGKRRVGALSRRATVSWKAPKTAFEAVLLPDSAAAIQPRIDAMKMNALPSSGHADGQGAPELLETWWRTPRAPAPASAAGRAG